MGELSRKIARLSASDSSHQVSFSEAGDGRFECRIAPDVVAVAKTPKKALKKAWRKWKREYEGGPWDLKKLRRAMTESSSKARDLAREANHAADAAVDTLGALRRAVPVDSEPEAITRTMNLLGLEGSTNYQDLFQRVELLVRSEERPTLPQRNPVALIDTLIAMVRRAGTEMPGRVLRETFELDLAALLKEHGIEAPPVARRETKT